MITLHWYDNIFIADKAVRYIDRVVLYNDINTEVCEINHIEGNEWNHIILEGEWTDASDIPTSDEILRADVDFLTMENEYLESVNQELQETVEQDRADIDYCLMLLEG